MNVGIIGAGTIGTALAEGFEREAAVTLVGTTTRATAGRNADVARTSDVLFLCVKPQHAEPVLAALAPALRPHHVLVSTVAGVSVAALRAWSGECARVVRTMPNIPLRVGAGVTVIARSPDSCLEAVATTRSLFAPFGTTVDLDESLLDAATAISGCSPAFIFVVMEALIDAAIALGITYEDARRLVAQTVAGSAALLLAGDAHPAQLKTQVATPAGKTVRGLLHLESAGVRGALMHAALASAAP